MELIRCFSLIKTGLATTYVQNELFRYIRWLVLNIL